MKKSLLFVACVLILGVASMRVHGQGNCPFHVQMEKIDATCLNNGGVQFTLLDDNNNEIAIDVANGKPFDDSFDLSVIKFYYRAANDTTTYYSTNPRLYMSSGTYTVGAQAQCYMGGVGEGAFRTLDTNCQVTIYGSYTVPEIFVLANIATSSRSCGNRPTLPCGATGRIQLKITGGSFPYTVRLYDAHTNALVREVVYNNHQSAGRDQSMANYQDYYTIDNLEAGDYYIDFTDACDFHSAASSLSWTVEDVNPPMLTEVRMYTYNPNNQTAYNELSFYYAKFTEGEMADYLMDMYAEHLQYRVCYGTVDTSEWKSFPLQNLQQRNDKTYEMNQWFYDAAPHVTRYCQLNDQVLTFQFRNSFCHQDTIISRYSGRLRVSNGNESYSMWYGSEHAEDVDYSGTWYDSCTYHIPSIRNYTDYYYSYINGNAYTMSSTYNPNTNRSSSFATAPYTFVMTDTRDNREIKRETKNNRNYFYVYKTDFEGVYGEISDTTINIPVKVEMTDAKGCKWTNTYTVDIYDNTENLDGYFYLSSDQYYYSEAQYCCQESEYFQIFEYSYSYGTTHHLPNPIPARFKQTRDGAQFKCVRSPRGNKYNFTATYDYSTDSWTVVKDSVTNNAEITPYVRDYEYEYRWGLQVSDYCLPYGRYEFEYTTDCRTQNYTVWFNGQEYRYVYSEPSFSFDQECDNYYINLTGGLFQRQQVGTNTSISTQPEQINSTSNLNTYFKIVNGPQGGYPTADYRVGSTIRLSSPGTYTLRMFTPDTTYYCRAPYFDTTFSYTGGSVSFDYAVSYVCDVDSTVGFIYSRAKDGMPPYVYTLYSQPAMGGQVIATNGDGSFRGISNIHVGDILSLQVEDACGRSFYLDMTVSDLAQSQLAWFDGALRVTQTCEGSEIDVYVSSLDENFTYHWTGPNGFEAQTARGHIFIDRGASSGYYSVELGNTGCSASLQDSVELSVIQSPRVDISDGTSVCPGESVQLSFTPAYGNGRVSYTIGKEVNSEVTFYNYNGNVGQTQYQTYEANSEAKFWIHSVSDNLCTYTIPEDTITILLRNTSTACDVTVSDASICYGDDAQVTANSTTMLTPYTVKWYADADQNNLLLQEEITSGGEVSAYTLDALSDDLSLYVTVQDAVHCEPQVGTIHSWTNMGNTTSTLACGESMRFFDDGGVNGNYSGNANLRHVFTSDGNNAITLSFNGFNTQEGADVVRVYTGNTVNQDSLLGSFSGTSLPASVTSKSNTMTVVFTSNGYIDASGWDAVVSCSALPAKVSVSVTEPMTVSLSPSPELPARYNNNISLTATAAGGRGEQYHYQWYVMEPNSSWELKFEEITASTTSTYSITPILTSQTVKVVVSDGSTDACLETVEESMYLEISDIEMTLSLNSPVSEMCQGDLSVDMSVSNAGGETASNVKVKVNLPVGMRFSNVADTLISMGNIGAGSTAYRTINLVNEGHFTVVRNDSIKAQIWSCDQGDALSSYHNWNWTGVPTEQDEAVCVVVIHPSVDVVTANSVTINTENICYEADAHFEAVNTAMDAPLYYNWYADAALTQLLKSETINDNTTPSTLDLQGVTEATPAYLTVTNDSYCPAYGTVGYTVKMSYPVTGTVLMCDGSMTIGNEDHVMFYDDGGPNGNYTANKNYTYLFTSADGSPIMIYFNNGEGNYIYSNTNEECIEIYDGDNDLTTPRLAMYRWTDMRDRVLTAHTGKMMIKFKSGVNTGQGISAHVFTSGRLFAKEAKVVFKNATSDAAITTTGAELCPGEEAVLTASSNIATPQYYTWYSQDRFSVLKRDTVTQGNTSTFTVTPAEEAPYFVSVSNDENCSQSASPYTNYYEVLMNGSSNSYTLAANDMIGFFDAGGISGNVETNQGYTYYFYPPEGSRIHLHINSMDLGNNAYMRIYKRIGNSNYTLAELRGTQTNLDYEIEDNYLRVYFWNGSSNVCPGWDARIYAVAPQDSNTLTKAEIHFKPYQSPDSVLVSTTPICYGEEATLTATSNDTHYPQYYTWYNPDRTAILKQETVTAGNVSTLTLVPQSGAYWVGMATDATCPLMPMVHSNYREVLMNGQERTVNLSTTDSIGFFDAGGRSGNFEPSTGYTYYFYAPEGSKIHLHINSFNIGDCAYMYLYDRNYQFATIRGNKSNVDLVSESNYLQVHFWNGCSSTYPGWDAYIYVETSQDASALAKAEVQFKPSMESGLIVANNPAICYGEDVEVTASSNLNSTQYYKWYDSELNLLREETVAVGGQSTLPLSNVTSHTYYVAVHSDSICPVNLRESVLLNSATHNQTTVVRAGQAIAFYDDGGVLGNYSTGSQKQHTFTAENGQIALHFSSFEAYNGYLYIYDGTNTDYQIGDLYETQINRNFVSTTGSLTVIWESSNADSRAGWEALVSVVGNGQNNTTTVFLDASQNHQRTYIAPDAGVMFYDDGGYTDSRSSNVSYEHTFTALEGSVRIYFDEVSLCSDDRIYLYDGETASVDHLIREFYQRPPQAITTSGRSLTVRFVSRNCCCPSGWRARLSTVSPQNEMKEVNITFKEPVKVDAAYSLTQEVCYGGSAVFVAQSSIAYPQYYAWYDENLSLLQQDVIQAGQDTLVLDRVVNDNYYVAVYNDQECPVIVENNEVQNISPEFNISSLPLGSTDVLLLESSENGQMTVLGNGDVYDFYDEGGALSDYFTQNVNWTHTFKAVGGHVVLHFNSFSSEECCDYMRIYDGQSTSGNLLDELRGNISDVTYLAKSGYLTIQWYTNGGSAVSSGWDAVVTGTDFVMEQVEVSFQQPTSPSLITTMGETVCYGREATLRARADIAYPQYYTWFSPDRRDVIARDTVWQSGEMSELTVLPRTATSYYVAVSNDNTCPINSDLHLSYHEIIMGEGGNNYTLSSSDSIGFFDMGGKNGNFVADDNSYQYYFYASEGSYIRFHINEMQLGSGYFELYDRNWNRIAYMDGNRSDEDFVITDNYLRVYFYTSNSSAMGWDSYVYAITPQDADNLAAASVNFNAAGLTAGLSTQGDNACYGGQAVLMASSNNLAGPQYYYWYDENLNLVYQDTVATGDTSRCVIDPVAAAQTYYVSAGNSETCPVVLAEKTVLMSSNNQTTIVHPGQPVAFYDDGGPDGDYSYSSGNGHWWYHTFVAESGQLILRFSDFESQDDNWNDYMYIYDEGPNSTAHLGTMYSRYSEIDRTYISTSGRLRVQWYTNGTGSGPGWRATVEVLSGENATVPTVLMNETNNQGQTMVAPNQVVYFYDDGGRNGSMMANTHNFSHTFTALQGNIAVSFPSCINICGTDSLYAYDGENANAPLLGKWGNYDCSYPRIVSTGKSITFVLKGTCCCPEGWRAVVSSVNAQNSMAQADVSVKVVSPNSITTIGDTVCYGSSATLAAVSDIGSPQYYTWFSPDRMNIIYRDTVQSGDTSKLIVNTAVASTSYYVAVYNDTTCPVVTNLHPNYQEILMNCRNGEQNCTLAAGDSVGFFDNGGKDGDYIADYNGCYFYFYAEDGASIRFHINTISLERDAYMYLYNRNGNQIAYINGNNSNLDYIINDNYLQVYFYEWGTPAMGWDAYVYAITPQDESSLAETTISIKEATALNSITTVGDTVCYGGKATLKATSEIGYPQYYTWFSPDRMNIIYCDTVQIGDTSRYTVNSVTTPTYYVAVSNDTTCPIVTNLHPNYREVLMNCNGGSSTYTLAAGDSIGFFDNGGKDGNYRANSNSCEYYFYAPEGSYIRFHIDTIAFGSNAYMYLYNRNGNQIAYLNSSIGNLDYFLNDNYLRVYFYEGYSPAMGWEAYLYAVAPQDASSLAAATVAFKTPLSLEHINTDGDQVCYGTEAHLSATSDIAYPQYFTWYDENLSVKQRDTLYQSGETSNYAVEHVYTDQAYYVTVGNDTACTLSMPGEMLLLNSSTNGKTSIVTKSKSISFYDDGGPNGNYTPGTSYTHTFTADSGQVTMTVSSFYSNGGCDMLYIYDGLTTSGNSIGSITSNPSNVYTYTSTTGSLTVRWNSSCSTPNYPGWEAVVKVADGQSNASSQTVILDENAHRKKTTVIPNLPIAFYDDGGPDDRHGSNLDYMHTFTAMYGAVSIQFSELSFCNGNMYFYEGDTIEESRLITTFNNNTNSYNRKVTSSGRSMTVRFVSQNCCCSSGWRATVTAVNMQNEMAEVEAKLKYTSRGDITAKGDTVCYGNAANLMASSSMSTPQYYTWFGPDLTEVVLRDTVWNSGEVSTCQALPEEETRYYVAVTCDTTCPLVTPVRYNYREVSVSTSSSSTTYTVAKEDSLVFYDEGGADGLFAYGYRYYYFYGADGAQLHLHFDTVCLGDQGASMTIYTRQGNTRTLANLTGNHGNLDYVSDDNYLYVYFYNNNLSLFDGWKGYVVTALSQDTGAVVMVPVRFQRPEVNHNIQSTDVVACYGEDVVLSARMDEDSISYPQYFAWYDKDFNLLKQEIISSDSSTLTVPALSNTLYYVNVTAENECPVLPPNNDVLLNSSVHGKTTVVSVGQMLNFYDDGGPNGDYSYTSNNINHTFKAESGQISLTMKAFNSHSGCDILEIYDGTSTSGNRIREYRGTYDNINETLTSTTGSLTVSWGTHCGTYNYSGWKAEISVAGTAGNVAESIVFDSVHVSLMDPTINNNLTVVDATVCYGDSATLTATSDMPGTLNFAWYDEYQNLIKNESSTTGSSSLKVLAYRDQTYYVNVSSELECASVPAIPSPKQISTVLLNYSNNNQTTTLQPIDSIRFFDSGGLSSSYDDGNYNYTHTFTANGKLKAEFFSNYNYLANDDTLYVYDSDHADAARLLGILVQANSNTAMTYVSTGHYLTFKFANHYGNCCYDGWNTAISMIGQDYPMAEAHVSLRPSGSSAQMTVVNDTVCYGSEATLRVASDASYPQYYTWYAPDRYTIIHRDTLSSAGYSSYSYVPTEEESLYVLVTDNSSCPVVEQVYPNLRSITMPENNTTYTIAAGDSIRFYDPGGPNGAYGMYRSWNAYFMAEEGSYLRVHFDTLDINLSNNSCQLQISDSRGTMIATLDGHRSNLDYLIADNYVRFYFYSYTSTVFSGWESYIYAVRLPEEEAMAKPKVAFKTPVISDQVSVGDVEACYGSEAVLTASTNIPAPQHFAWYDNDYNLVKEELVTSGSSDLDVLVVSDTIYHVNVCAENECSVLPPSMIPVRDVLLNADASGKTTRVHPHKILGFYDEGGPDGIYTTYGANWTHTFTADSGQVVIHFTNYASSGGCDRIYIYDGTSATGNYIGYYTSTYSSLDDHYTSTNGSLTVHWRTECSGTNYAGWNATVYVAGAEDNTYNELDMPSAQVRVKPIVPAAHITTTNDTVCFGTETMLTAVSDIAYPQYYTWFDEDRMTVLHRDTVGQAGENSVLAVTPVIDKTYYVAVATDSTCPVIPVENLELKEATVALKKSQLISGVVTSGDTACYGQSVTLSANTPSMAYPQKYLWFDENMTLLKSEQITDGNSTLEVESVTSTKNYYVTVGNETVCPMGARHETLLLDASAHNKTTPVGIGTVIELYDEGGPSGPYHTYGSSWQHTFTADTGQVVLNLTEYASSCGCDQLTIYDGTTTSGSQLGSMTCTQSNVNAIYTSTTGSLTVHWRQECSGSNYAGFAATVKNSIEVTDLLAYATASVKEPSNSLPLTAVPDVTCEGTEAMLTASSTIAKPQYYMWYSPDKTLLLVDTVDGTETESVLVGPAIYQDQNTQYYVSVGNDENCPQHPIQIKDNIREVWLTNSVNGDTTIIGEADSLMFYDEGGPNGDYTTYYVTRTHTFKSTAGPIRMHVTDFMMSPCSNTNILAICDGEISSENVLVTLKNTMSDTTVTTTGDVLTIFWHSDSYCGSSQGWSAQIYTVAPANNVDSLTAVDVTVNLAYDTVMYDTVYSSFEPYSVGIFRNINVAYSDTTLVIDSVFQTDWGCDSTYTLKLTVLPSLIIASNSNSWTYDGWYHSENSYTVSYGVDTLTANAGSDGKVFTLPGSGDVLTITPDATAEVIYYTPTPVPNSFSYTLDNESNYPSVITDTGTLEIVPIATAITITANSDAKFYDGTPLTNDGFTYTPDDVLIAGDTMVAEIVGSITEIGDSLNRVISIHVFRNENFNRRGVANYTIDVTDCYTFDLPVSGTLSIVDSIKLSVVASDVVCQGENDGVADITVTGGKDVTPDRYAYAITGENTSYSESGNTEGTINLVDLGADNYTVTVTDALGLTATATFTIEERPVLTPSTPFDCPANIDTVIKNGGCNLVLVDIGTPNIVLPTGLDMADVTIYNNAPADNIYEVGETTITWVVKGLCNDSITCDQLIKVSFQLCDTAVDFEGNKYPSVRLGASCKCWTTENLKSTKYSDGRSIEDVMDYYSNEYPNMTQNVDIFGHLYSWYAAADTDRYGSVDSVESAYLSGHHLQGICPEGWYLPSDDDYEELNIYPTTDLRSTSYWINISEVVNTNATGFNSLPGGMYNCSTGRFEDMMGESYYWTCHPVYDMATGAMIDYICEKILVNNSARCNGYSIRCIWDEH